MAAGEGVGRSKGEGVGITDAEGEAEGEENASDDGETEGEGTAVTEATLPQPAATTMARTKPATFVNQSLLMPLLMLIYPMVSNDGKEGWLRDESDAVGVGFRTARYGILGLVE